MSGILKLSDGSTWKPVGWVYDKVLSLISEQLDPQDAALKTRLAQGMTNAIGHFDVGTLDGSQKERFIAVAQQAYFKAVTRGPATVDNPAFYPGFISQFEKLTTSLREIPAQK